jgi:hypothetical protein
VFGSGLTNTGLLDQINQLGKNFGDLGPWQILVDAGWQELGGPESELGTLDLERFPNGIREITEAAHQRNLQVVLYLGIGFVHSGGTEGGEWLALPGLIERHPSWLIPFHSDASTERRYLLDFGNPEVRDYVRGLLRDFFLVHGADGVSIDGLTDGEGQLVPRIERDSPNGPPYPLLPSLDIYRFIREEVDRLRPGAFIESGWANPAAAAPYAQVFRYGDETDTVNEPYPFAGFMDHLDYALFGRKVIGQRVYLGTPTGDPRRRDARWWTQAAAALGVPATISIDMHDFDAPRLSAFRADLNALVPYQGVTRFGPGLFPQFFATTRDGTTYLGLVNREWTEQEVRADLASLGLDGDADFAVFDVEQARSERARGSVALRLPARSFRLVALRSQPGVLWSDSVVDPRITANTLTATMTGPSEQPGFVYLATPAPKAVTLDGSALERGSTAARDRQYAYDEQSGVLALAFSRAHPRRLEVQW